VLPHSIRAWPLLYRFGDQYPTLKPRVLKTLCEAGLDLSKPLPTNYGGIVGLSLFGPKAIDAFLLPVAAEFWTNWEDELQNKSGNKRKAGSLQQDLDMRQCQQALLNALCDYVNSEDIFLDKNSVLRQESFKEVFEEKLIPMTVDLSQYAACFI
jgi:transcription initiation factor TFIID subunit 6